MTRAREGVGREPFSCGRSRAPTAFRVLRTAVLLLFAIAAGGAAQDARLEARLQRATIYAGESVGYTVFAINCGDAGRPELGPLEGLSATYLSASTESSYQQDGFGRVRQLRIVKHHYSLQSMREGEFTVPPPRLVVGARTLTGPSLALEVIGPEKQDLVLLELSAEPVRVYRQQPFTIRLDLWVRAIPAPYQDRDPLAIQQDGSQPRLEVPWLEPAPGLRTRSAGEWLRGYQNQGGDGFTVNQDSERRSPLGIFGGLGGFGVATYLPRGERVVREDPEGASHEYFHYRMQRTYDPRKAGEYTFGAVSLKGVFCDGVETRADASGRRTPRLTAREIYALSAPVTVRVVEPPEAGRPATFTGGIGTFRVWASAEPKKLRVGDPLTVTLHVEGAAGLEEVGPLSLATQEAITRDFKVYEDAQAGEISRGRKNFVHSLRPLTDRVTELPAIAFSYFDVKEEAYRTVQTAPVPLEVVRAEKLDPTEVVVSRSASRDTDLVARAEGIFANITDPGQLRNDQVHAETWFGGLLVLVLGYLGLAASVRFVRRRNADPAVVRRRGAFARAHEALRAARRAAGPGEAANAIRAVFTALTADLRDVPPAGLTARDVARLAADIGDADLGMRLGALLDRCEAARFGASSIEADDARAMVGEAEALLRALAVRHRKARKTLRVVAVVGLAWIAAAGAGPAQPEGATRLFVKAQERYETAREPEDFLAAAALYARVLDVPGYRNGAVLYNQGNAYLRGGELGRAIAAYREAKRYRPNDPQLDANLRHALTRRVDQFPEPSGGLIDQVFFWTRAVAYRDQFLATAVVAGLAFLLGLYRLYRPDGRRVRLALAVAILAALLLAAGAALSTYRYRHVTHGVLVAPETQVRKAPGGAPAFDKPLHEGAEFTVIESRGQSVRGRWLRIRFAGDREGWVPAEAGVLY